MTGHLLHGGHLLLSRVGDEFLLATTDRSANPVQCAERILQRHDGRARIRQRVVPHHSAAEHASFAQSDAD